MINGRLYGKGSKAVVVLSGGQDSTTCLYYALAHELDVHCVTFNYGQRHSREVHAAKRIARMAGIPEEKHEIITLGPILAGTSPLVSDNELEQYKDHHSLPGGLEKTFVPMRNQLFLTLAANRAYILGANYVITGVCQEDFGGYPDCRREFIDAFEDATRRGTFTGKDGAPGEFQVLTPLMNLTKKDTVLLSLDRTMENRLRNIGLFEPSCYRALAFTHTGYDGSYPPVGKDHATLLRAKGFEEADCPDPLVIRAALYDRLMDLPDAKNYHLSRPEISTFTTGILASVGRAMA